MMIFRVALVFYIVLSLKRLIDLIQYKSHWEEFVKNHKARIVKKTDDSEISLTITWAVVVQLYLMYMLYVAGKMDDRPIQWMTALIFVKQIFMSANALRILRNIREEVKPKILPLAFSALLVATDFAYIALLLLYVF